MKRSATSSAKEALKSLPQGNTRFIKQLDSTNDKSHYLFKAKPLELVSEGQTPGCAILMLLRLSRATGINIRQGIGDLFVIRTAGNY